MIMRELMTGNMAAAWGMRLAEVDYLPAFPITPQTEIIETVARWVADGEVKTRMVTMDSEHSMVTAAGSAAATGIRVFTATSSQGLLYAMEMLYAVAGWRAPFVLVNVSRALSSPVTLEPDHNDVLAARDSGFLQLHCATCQEVVDGVLLAYRLAEDKRVRLPVIVNLDGYYLSFTREPLVLPTLEMARSFLPSFDSGTIRFRGHQPLSQGVAVLGGSQYSYFRYQCHLAAMNGLDVFAEVAAQFGELTGRHYQAVNAYRHEDAEVIFVMMGSFSGKARVAVDHLRKKGLKAGLVRLFLLRPFPENDLVDSICHCRGVAVIDQNISMGKGGVLYGEIASALYNRKGKPEALVNFIGGLGGRDITSDEFFEMFKITAQAAADGRVPSPRLLYSRDEYGRMQGLRAMAGAEGKRDDR